MLETFDKSGDHPHPTARPSRSSRCNFRFGGYLFSVKMQPQPTDPPAAGLHQHAPPAEVHTKPSFLDGGCESREDFVLLLLSEKAWFRPPMLTGQGSRQQGSCHPNLLNFGHHLSRFVSMLADGPSMNPVKFPLGRTFPSQHGMAQALEKGTYPSDQGSNIVALVWTRLKGNFFAYEPAPVAVSPDPDLAYVARANFGMHGGTFQVEPKEPETAWMRGRKSRRRRWIFWR